MRVMNQWYRISLKTLLLITVAMAGSSTVLADTTESSCVVAANNWITPLASDKSDILQSHAQARCTFSAQWLTEYKPTPGSNSQKQMCTDLVLIWTYKECVYFRDSIDHEAYAPCQTWARSMYEQCINNNISWFQ